MLEIIKPKNGFVIPIIGRQECGKTPFIKWFLKQSGFMNSIVNDVNREYEPELFTLFYGEHEEYIKIISYETLINHCFIIHEEAGEYFYGKTDEETKKVCGRIAHNINIYAPIFLTLDDCPKGVLKKSRYIALFDTLDDEKDIKSNRYRYYQFFIMKEKPLLIDNYNLTAKPFKINFEK